MKHELVAILAVLILAMGLSDTGLADSSFAPVLAPTSTYYVANTEAECGGMCSHWGPTALQMTIDDIWGTATIIVIGAYQSNSNVVIDAQNITLRRKDDSASLSQTGFCTTGRLLYVTGFCLRPLVI